MTLRRVLLPQPDGPMMRQNVFLGNARTHQRGALIVWISSRRRTSGVRALLADVSARFPRKHFAASSAVRLWQKHPPQSHRRPSRVSDGSIAWDGRDLAEEADMDPHEIGYVPSSASPTSCSRLLRTWKARSGCEWQGSTPKNVKLTLIKSFAKWD